MAVTLDALKSGIRERISSKEFAALRGCSEATLCRERNCGSGPKYRRDARAKIWYYRDVVLQFFDALPEYGSTSQYRHRGCERMEKARNAKSLTK